MDALTRASFDASTQGLVADFDCGDEPWELEVSNWIKIPAGDEGPLDVPGLFGTKVWLYFDGNDQVVGFGSLGPTELRIPGKRSPKLRHWHIPFIAIGREFRGKPAGPRDDRYASQIMNNILSEAMKPTDLEPYLSLYVDERNKRAIEFYSRFGFEFLQHHQNSSGGVRYLAMFAKLAEGGATNGSGPVLRT